MPAEITAEQLVQKVREQAQAHPDKVYEKDPDVIGGSICVYAHSYGPGCIIGWGLHDLGWSLDDLRTLDDQNNSGIYELIVWRLVPGMRSTQREVEWLRVVQGEQDNGKTWSEAVARADSSA